MVKTDAELLLEAEQIQNETNKNANTQVRVGAHLINLAESKVNNDKIESSPALNTAGKLVAGRDAVKAYIDERVSNLQNNSNFKFLGYYEDEADINLNHPTAEKGSDVINLETNTHWLYSEELGWTDSGREATPVEMDQYPTPGSFSKTASSGGIDERLGEKSHWNHGHTESEQWLIDILAFYIKSSSFDQLFWDRLKVSVDNGDNITIDFNEETRIAKINGIPGPGGSITIDSSVIEGSGNAVAGGGVFNHTKQFLNKYIWKTTSLAGNVRTFDFENVQNPVFRIEPTEDEEWVFVNVPIALSEFVSPYIRIKYSGIPSFTASLPTGTHWEDGTDNPITEIPFPTGKGSGYITSAFGYRSPENEWTWSFGEGSSSSGGASSFSALTGKARDNADLADELDAAEQNAKDYADTELANKVDKVSGKGLSTNDYTNLDQAKVAAIDQSVSSTEKATWNAKADTSYVDAKTQGLKWKDEAKAATTANITLSGSQTIDGISIVAGDRVLVKDQTTGSENGIYVAASGAWSRSTDADTAAKIKNATVPVAQGTINADLDYVLVTDTITLGTTSLVFTAKGGSVPNASTTTAGKSEQSTAAEIASDSATGGSGAPLFVDPSTLAGSKYLSQSLAKIFANTTNSGNAYAAAFTPAVTSYPKFILININAANTGTATINPDGLGAKTLKKRGSVDLIANDLKANTIYAAAYDGTNYQLLNDNGINEVLTGFAAISGVLANIAATDSVLQGVMLLEQRRKNIGKINVKDYGATGNGTTNDTSAINAAITAAAVGQTVFFPDGNYLVSGTGIAVNKSINIEGGWSRITTTSNISMMTITANNVKINRMQFLGSGKASGLTSQNGISSDGYYYFSYTDIECYSLGGAGTYVKNTNVTGLRQGGRINNFYANGCYIGLCFDTSAEYVSVNGGTCQLNTTGIVIRCGNVVFSGFHSDDNSVGMSLEAGTNNGHGSYVGGTINHNTTYNVKASDVTLGFVFSGSHFYDSNIWLKNTVGIKFVGCHVAPIALFFENSKGTTFEDCTLYRAYGFAKNDNYNSTQSQTNWVNCRDYNGIAGSYAENVYGGYCSTDISVGASIPTGSSFLLFNTPYQQATGGNTTQTLYAFWNSSDRTFQNFGLGNNKVNINFNLNLAVNASADISKILVALDVYYNDGTTRIGTQALVPSFVYESGSTTNRILIFSLQGTYGIDPTNKYKIRVENNSGFSATVAASPLGANGVLEIYNRIVFEGL